MREAVDAFVARLRRDLDAHVHGLQSDLSRLATENQEYWRTTLERSVIDARQDAERGFKARLEALRNELTREMDVRLATERSQLQAATAAATKAAAEAARLSNVHQNAPAQPGPHVHARDARVDTLERVLTSVRRIDSAVSLSEILEALADGVSAETSRVSILVVDGDHLRPLLSHGFAHGHAPHDLSIQSSGLLTATIALGQTSFVNPLIVREINTPSFMHVPVGHTGLVVPMAVGGDVVAVLYADDVGRADVREDAPAWADEVDWLVRHAAVRLETITAHRTNEVAGS